MVRIVEIENGIARVVDRQVVSEVATEALAPFLQARTPLITPTLPKGTVRVAFSGETDGLFEILIEQPPRIEPVHFKVKHYELEQFADELGLDPNNGDTLPDVLMLPVPWEYFHFFGTLRPRYAGENNVLAFTQGCAYWRFAPIGDLVNPSVYSARLPNVQSYNGAICWGSLEMPNETLATKFNLMVNTFYESAFNDSMGHMSLPATVPQILAGIPIDIFGCPQYDTDTWNSFPLNFGRNIEAPIAGARANFDPPAWNIAAIREWTRDLTPARQATLRNLLPPATP